MSRGHEANRAEADLRRRLAQLPDASTLAEVELTPVSSGGPTAGTRPAAAFEDACGRRYLFKAAEPALVAAEELASTVLSLGARPAIPVAARTLRLGDLGEVHGMLRPLLDHAGERLPTDPRDWTAVQAEVMLRGHPWEWFLANLDSHIDQYVLLTPACIPLNVDWDHTLRDLDVVVLTRFTNRNVALLPIRNLLYEAFVNGAVNLSFDGLFEQVERVRQLDEDRLAHAIERYARTMALDRSSAAELQNRLASRKAAMRPTFGRLVDSMRLERRAALHGGLALSRAIVDRWQRLAVGFLHDRVTTRLCSAYKALLARRLRTP